MSNLTVKSTATEIRQIAKQYNLVLEGDARKKGVKQQWVNQINQIVNNNEEIEVELLIGITAYQYTDKSKTLTQFMLDKFQMSEDVILAKISELISKGYLRHDSGGLELTSIGSHFMHDKMIEQQIYIAVVDNQIKEVLSYENFYYPTSENNQFLFLRHHDYKAFASVHDVGVRVCNSVSSKPFSLEEVAKVIMKSEYHVIKKAVKFWQRYHEIFQRDLATA
jgi:hypothetical protein